MNSIPNKEKINEFPKLFFLFSVVLLVHIPFIFNGLGTDPDAWRIFLSAKNIFENNTYIPSRFPGFPIPEYFFSLIWVLFKGNPPIFIFNLITVFLSIISTFAFYFINKKINSGNPILFSFALSFTPLFYINSVNSMDYMWGVTFIILSFYFLIDKKYFIAGLILGLATGCRISSIAMLVPYNL